MQFGLFGIFDGHGGAGAAKATSKLVFPFQPYIYVIDDKMLFVNHHGMFWCYFLQSRVYASKAVSWQSSTYSVCLLRHGMYTTLWLRKLRFHVLIIYIVPTKFWGDSQNSGCWIVLSLYARMVDCFIYADYLSTFKRRCITIYYIFPTTGKKTFD